MTHTSHSYVQQSLQYLSNLLDLKKVVLVSDGCAAQFKSKLPFFFLTQTEIPGSEFSVEKVFFGSRHGKNDCDWCGGAVKRSVTRDVASGRVTIRNAQDMYEHCCRTLSTSLDADNCQHKVQNFFLVDETQIDRRIKSSMFTTVPGSRKIHHLRVLTTGVLATRQLSCFCSGCMAEQYDQCQSPNHVDKWDIVKMKYSGSLPSGSGSSQKDGLKRPVSKPSESDSVDTDVELPSDFCAEHQSPVVSQSESEGTDSDRVAVSEKGSESEDEGLHSEPTTERKIFFSHVLEELQRCSSFEEVQLLAEQKKEMIERFCLPVPSISNPVGSTTDRQTWLLLEPEVRHRCFPLCVEGDGSCFFRSLSLLLFGDEKHHVEMRCRIILEMAGNPKLFLDGRSWCGPHDRVSPEEIILVKATSVSSSPSLETAFQEEVMAV
ncbi:uncharacterized protein LOC143284214 [Babylonia areolata]|uniref:uncharacterized protein LOC143284214 n=1 Tax=Babylonia areolata TaxID=304850 RepID=UPI003FD675B3